MPTNFLQTLIPAVQKIMEIMISPAIIQKPKQNKYSLMISMPLLINTLKAISWMKISNWNILWLKISINSPLQTHFNMNKMDIMLDLVQMRVNSHTIKIYKNSSNKANIMLTTILKFLLIFKDLKIDNFNLLIQSLFQSYLILCESFFTLFYYTFLFKDTF